MNILATTENACSVLALTASLNASASVTIYNGLDNDEKAAPALIISATSAKEEFPGSGVWHVSTDLRVKQIAADTSTTSSLAETIFSAFCSGSTKTDLGKYTGFYCYDLFVEDTAMTVENDVWVQTMRFDIVCSLT